MITLRPGRQRGGSDYGWLNTYRFSFDAYHDPKFMGVRSVRVINEDIVQLA